MQNISPAELESYYKKIFKLALYYLKNSDEAEDIAQDIFLKVHERLPDFRGDSELYTWIYRIALNTLNNFLRRKKIVGFISFDSGKVIENDSNPAARLEEIDEKEKNLRKLEIAVRDLSEREKTAFYFYHYEGLRQKEIAKVMETTLSAVESLIFKAMKKIKKKLA